VLPARVIPHANDFFEQFSGAADAVGEMIFDALSSRLINMGNHT
jgi:hypothetical protein